MSLINRPRALLFVDGPNWYQQCKQELNGKRVDFTKMIHTLSDVLGLDIVRMMYYMAEMPTSNEGFAEQRKFLDALRFQDQIDIRLGFYAVYDGKLTEKMVDTQLVADMITMAAHPRAMDVVVLVSGDIDMLPGIIGAKQFGCATYVLSFPNMCAADLSHAADVYYRLTPDVMDRMLFLRDK